MVRTALFEKLVASGGRMGEYCGVETALAFREASAEFESLLRRCGIYDVGWRARFRISGKDRVRWLNGMVSNNIRELPPQRGNYNFVLTPQAHIQGDLYVYNLGDYYLAATERFQFETVLTLLRRYIIMDKVELTDVNQELTAIGVQGPNAREVLGHAGFEGRLPQAMEILEVTQQGKTLLATRLADERFESYEFWVGPAEAPALWDAITAAGAAPVGTDALEMFRVAAGIPRYSQDIRERDLPQETGQMQALSFTKGCYVGQEIVERIRSRGSVHRVFTGFTVAGSPPSPGTKVLGDGKEVGEVTSALAIPIAQAGGSARVFALGYLRREAAKPGTALEIAGARAAVAQLPFPEIFASEFSNAQ